MNNEYRNQPRVRYIPPVDTPCYSTYMGCYRVSPPGASTVPDTLGTNPRCPFKVCGLCASDNCNCYLNHMKNPFKHRYWVYDWNQY
jgi:hypothetical protein